MNYHRRKRTCQDLSLISKFDQSGDQFVSDPERLLQSIHGQLKLFQQYHHVFLVAIKINLASFLINNNLDALILMSFSGISSFMQISISMTSKNFINIPNESMVSSGGILIHQIHSVFVIFNHGGTTLQDNPLSGCSRLQGIY